MQKKKREKKRENSSPDTQWKGMEKKKRKKMQPNPETNVKRRKEEEEEEDEENKERWEPAKRKKKKKKTTMLERAKGLTVDLSICVYLQKYHHNFIYRTWKYLKCVFSFHNESFKNQRRWKQKLKTSPNKPFSHGTHIFWVMGNGNWKSKPPPS